MVQDAKRADPQYRGLIHGTGQIIKNEGFMGVYRGLFPVMMKQGTNSAVRFTSYQSTCNVADRCILKCSRIVFSGLKQFIQGNDANKQLSSAATFGIGGVAGLITTYASMPFE